jgi:glycosyltransferase involved in cell wall biosynthesis
MNFDGIDVRVINIRLSNRHGAAFRILTFLVYAILACWYALVLPADVVVASSGPLTVGLPGLVARYLRRKPLVFEVRDLWPEGAIQLGILRNKLAIRLARALEKTCYMSASRIVALSDGMADWIRNRYGIDHIAVVPNASDNELVERTTGGLDLPGWAADKHLAVYAGALGLIDDCGQILEVARVLRDRGEKTVEFVIIGTGKERQQLEERASDLGLANVHFLGAMPKEQVIRWLRAACCSLFTVKSVPFLETASPNKVFDAFAVGRPVIQSTQGWIGALLEREQCGINVPPNDMDAMADAVVLLARDASLRESLGRNAHRVAKEYFDRSVLAERMRLILHNCATTGTKRFSASTDRKKIVAVSPTNDR